MINAANRYVAFAMPRPEIGTRAQARNSEIQRCLKMNPKFIFMIDLDQTMPIRGWTMMIDHLMAEDADIAVIDTPPHDSEDFNVHYNPDGSIAFCSVACALIRSEVFANLPYPWFDSSFDYQPNGVKDGKIVFDKLLKSNDNNVGEDIYFVRNAIEAGLNIKYTTKIRCQHFRI